MLAKLVFMSRIDLSVAYISITRWGMILSAKYKANYLSRTGDKQTKIVFIKLRSAV